MKLTNGNLGVLNLAAPPVSAPDAGTGRGSASTAQMTGANVSDVQGTGALTGLHNTPLHVAIIVLAAGGGLAFFRYAGFRFSFDTGFGK
jgi:hypothetical protein